MALRLHHLHAAVAVFFSLLLVASGFQTYHEACRDTSEDPAFCISMLSESRSLEGVDVTLGTLGRFQLLITTMKSALDVVLQEIKLSESLISAPAPSSAPAPPSGAAPPASAPASAWLQTSLASRKPRTAALDDCVEQLTFASGLIDACLASKLSNGSVQTIIDVQTWMSAALSYQTTCLDGLSQVPPPQQVVNLMRTEGDKVGKKMSTALSFIASNLGAVGGGLDEAEDVEEDGTPSWVPKLLTSHHHHHKKHKSKSKKHKKASVVANVVVAQDGSGNYKSIQDAVDGAPVKSTSTYVIYIKSGTYKERVSVAKTKTNLMFMGDGMGKTIITGSASVKDGVTTYKTATVEVNGDGFLARDLTIRNTAGAQKHQAVAIRVSADRTAFYSCSFEGYQDTLYAHIERQFYRECKILGTVDFIFGNAAASFQSCTITARKPMDKQKNTVTAQGRTDKNQNTGFSFMDSAIDGTSDLKSSGTRSFLGRPWKQYSRTVYLRCYMGTIVDPAGWLEWSGDFALKTLFYAEYLSKGPSSDTGGRVSWSSQISSLSDASFYAPKDFISGGDWLVGTGFPFKLSL